MPMKPGSLEQNKKFRKMLRKRMSLVYGKMFSDEQAFNIFLAANHAIMDFLLAQSRTDGKVSMTLPGLGVFRIEKSPVENKRSRQNGLEFTPRFRWKPASSIENYLISVFAGECEWPQEEFCTITMFSERIYPMKAILTDEEVKEIGEEIRSLNNDKIDRKDDERKA